MGEPWTFLRSKNLFTCRIFSLKKEDYRSPRTGREHDFFILDSADWVNVIPRTADGRIILVKQYRMGTKDFSLEIPGGMLDEGDDPAGAAARELLEETGCEGGDPILLGVVHPNPAIQTNRCYTYLIDNVVLKTSPRQDSTEDIQVQSESLHDIPRLIVEGKITHALVIAAFYWYFSSTASKDSGPQGFE